jgi:hypothetical protein
MEVIGLASLYSPVEENLFQPDLIVAEERDNRWALRYATDFHKESLAIYKYCSMDRR